MTISASINRRAAAAGGSSNAQPKTESEVAIGVQLPREFSRGA